MKNRQSGIELLRIIGMFIICFSHCRRVFNFNEFSGIQYILNYISWGNIGNLIFIIISNYFLSDNNTVDIKKIKSIIIDQFVISMLVTFLTVFVFKKQMNFITFVKQVFILFYGGNWFITIWLIYYLIHPYLNLIINNMTKETYTKFVIILVVFYGVLRIIPSNSIPVNSLIDFVVLHFIVAYCKRNADNILEKKIGNTKFLLFSLVIFLLSIQALMLFSDITKYDFWLSGTYRTYFPMVLVVLSLFYIFKKFKFSNKIINEIGGLCLLNYMIHENYYFKKYGDQILINKISGLSYIERHGYLLLFTIAYFIFCFIIAYLYQLIKRIIVLKVFRT